MTPQVKQQPVDLRVETAEARAPAVKDQWRLIGKLAPAIVILWIAVDLFSRLLNPTIFQLDPWLVVSRFPPRYAPFTPDQSFYLPVYIGSNARLANVPPTETGGPIQFSTDHLGFRKTPSLAAQQAPKVLFLQGDSFIYGVALSDNQTLPNVMTSKYKIPSYNGGRFHDDPDGMPELDWLLDHLPGRPSTVVYTYLEHRAFAAPTEMRGLAGAIRRKRPSLEGDLRYLRLLNTFFWELSPSRVVTTRFFNKLNDDKFFPNENEALVRSLAMPDGRKMLFRDYEYALPDQDRGPDAVAQTARGFDWLQAEMDKRHLRLIVLLMPNRYSIYEPLLTKQDKPWTHYLDQLDAELHKRGIETVNGLEVYRSTAAQQVQNGQLPFYLEDAHWNPRGVEQIAVPVAEAIAKESAKHVIQ